TGGAAGRDRDAYPDPGRHAHAEPVREPDAEPHPHTDRGTAARLAAVGWAAAASEPAAWAAATWTATTSSAAAATTTTATTAPVAGPYGAAAQPAADTAPRSGRIGSRPVAQRPPVPERRPSEEVYRRGGQRPGRG